jgi:hypothetical protein
MPDFGYFPIGYFFTGYFPEGWYPDSFGEGAVDVTGAADVVLPAIRCRARGRTIVLTKPSGGVVSTYVPAQPRPNVKPPLVVVRPEAIVGVGVVVLPAITAAAVLEFQMFSDRDLEDIAVFLLAMEG